MIARPAASWLPYWSTSASRLWSGLPKIWLRLLGSSIRPERASPPRQAEHALADDVALDLAGAAGDRVLPGAEHAVVPAGGVGHRLGRRVDRRVGAEQGRGEIGDAQGELRAEQFEDRPLW